MLYIKASESLSDVLLINAMGQVIGMYNAAGQTEYEINLHGLQKGIYIINLRMKDKVVNKTVILNR